MPAWLLPAISAGVSLASQGWNNMLQRNANKEARDYAEKTYQQQRRDNEAQWHMQNAYNSPQSQMARLQSAGLNPNMVYGAGGVTQNAPPIGNTNAQSYSPAPQKVALSDAMGKYFDVKIQQAQYDNLKAQNTVLLEEAALKRANTEYIQSRDSMTNYDLSFKDRNRQAYEDKLAADAHGSALRNGIALEENERRNALTASNLAQAVEKIASMRLGRKLTEYEIHKLKNDIQLQQQSLELGELGLYKDAPWFLKMLGTYVNKFLND